MSLQGSSKSLQGSSMTLFVERIHQKGSCIHLAELVGRESGAPAQGLPSRGAAFLLRVELPEGPIERCHSSRFARRAA